VIDDLKQAAQLLHDMNARLPIPVHLTPHLLETLRSRGTQLRFDEEVLIDSVLYLGDEGGIACGLKVPGAGKDAVITSLTHLRIWSKVKSSSLSTTTCWASSSSGPRNP